MNLNDFDEPFVSEDIEWRVQQCGKTGQGKIWAMVLAYVTNRAIMKRLDDVCGKAGWRNEYRDIPNNGGVECGISIKVDGEWITKWDAAENTQVEAVKGGRSGAMKRAAVQWGIGRYLYNLEEGFAQISEQRRDGWNRAKTKDNTSFYWAPPAMPAWALPKQKAVEKAKEEPNQEQQKTPFDILKEFSAAAEKSTDAKHLQQLFGPVWKALIGTEEQAKAKEVYDIRKSELEGK